MEFVNKFSGEFHFWYLVKNTKRSVFIKRLKNIYSLVDELDISLFKSQQTDRQIVTMMKIDDLKDQSIAKQLKEAQKENKQLLNMFQLDDSNGRHVPRTNSTSSCGTVSLVHLQYKYEELLANQNGLLKILEMRHEEIRKYHKENVKLKEEIETLKFTLQKYEMEFTKLLEQIRKTKKKKNRKILRIKTERDTLRMVHNKFVALLHKQSMEQDYLLIEQLKTTDNSEKALLIQEIRKNNNLAYENFQLHQKVDYLESKLKTNLSKKALSTKSSNGSSTLSR